jgi:FkbM family methyltransferase
MKKKIRTRYGEIAVPNLLGDLIIRHLEKYGEWAYAETQFISSLLRNDAKILDVGAFLGTFSLGMAEGFPLRTFTLLEANPTTFEYLHENVDLHLSQTAVCLNQLLVPEGEQISKGWTGVNNLGSTSFLKPKSVDEGFYEVEVCSQSVSLHEIIDKHGPFDLIKLDIEGMEESIIGGLESPLDLRRSLLWLECNESRSSLDLVEHLVTWGEPVHYCAFPVFNPKNYMGSEEPIFPFAYEAGLLVGEVDVSMTNPDARFSGIIQRVDSVDQLAEAMWYTPRWGLKNWENLPIKALIAQAAHDLIGEERGSYLWSTDKIERHIDNDGPSTKESTLLQRVGVLERELQRLKNIIQDQEKVINDYHETISKQQSLE